MSDTMVEVDSLVIRYGDKTAVNGLSFEIKKGELFGLLGPNGAGKTSTISVLGCLTSPTEGNVTIGGHDIKKETKKVKNLIGFVPQDIALFPGFTAYQNLEFFGEMCGLKGKLLKKRINESLELASLTDRAHHKTGSFSGGMQRRLNLAVGLMHHPQFVMLDEPTVGVDPQSRNKIFEDVLKLNKETGITVLYTTHYMEEVERLCDRTAIMDGGKVIALDSPKNLIVNQGQGKVELTAPGADESLLAEMKQIPFVREASLIGHHLDMEITEISRALPHVVNLISSRNLDIASMNVVEPSLESVFLRLTGRHLRDSGEAVAAVEEELEAVV